MKKNYFLRIISVLSITLLLFLPDLYGSTGNSLTRQKALNIINNSVFFPRYSIIRLPIGSGVNLRVLITTAMDIVGEGYGKDLNTGYKCASDLGHLSLSRQRYGMFNVSVTNEGKKYGSIINKTCYGYSQYYAYRVARKSVYRVTGIRTISNSEVEVEFVTRLDHITKAGYCIYPNITYDHIQNIGRASLVLFDDGWRVEKMKFKGAYKEWVDLPKHSNQAHPYPNHDEVSH